MLGSSVFDLELTFNAGLLDANLLWRETALIGRPFPEDEREKAFEKKFVIDQELKFKAEVPNATGWSQSGPR